MKEKIKKIVLGYLPGFVIGIIVCGGVSVIAATYFPSNQTTYDNSASGMAATDVQGAIDELYNTCFPPKTGGDAILDDVDIVNSGDGLYADEYEEGKYTYKGANPNNYVTFNNEEAGWRIISINSDWMYYSSDYWWTLSPRSGNSLNVFRVISDGYVGHITAGATDGAVRPAITLSSEVKITGGDGSESNPYIISL